MQIKLLFRSSPLIFIEVTVLGLRIICRNDSIPDFFSKCFLVCESNMMSLFCSVFFLLKLRPLDLDFFCRNNSFPDFGLKIDYATKRGPKRWLPSHDI